MLMLTNLMEIFNLEHILLANPRVKKRNFFCKFKHFKNVMMNIQIEEII